MTFLLVVTIKWGDESKEKVEKKKKREYNNTRMGSTDNAVVVQTFFQAVLVISFSVRNLKN